MTKLTRKTKIKIGVAVAAVALLVVFMVLNRQVVELNLILGTVEMPRSVMLFCVLGIGFLLGWVTCSFIGSPKKIESRDTKP
jgi:uncharacterized integral membrane protein